MASGKTSRTFGWILMGLVMVGLVGFGSTNFGGSINAIGKVGDTDIDANRYARELRAEMSAFQAQTGSPLTLQQAEAFGLDQQVLARVIAAAALENETARLGLSVGDAELRDRIVDIPAFKGVDGKFDREGYTFALQQSGLTPAKFEQSLRAEVSSQIVQAAVANGIAVQPTYVDTLYGYAREERDFTWGVLGSQMLTTPLPSPSEAELTAYYEAHPDTFTLPEIKVITYAWMDPQAIVKTVTVEESQIRALYDERADTYQVPERRMVERLAFASSEDAQAAMDAITAGEKSFEDLVAARNLDLADIDLGDVTKEDLGAAGEAIFALESPGVTGPHDSTLGPALFRMNAVLNAHSTSFEEAREELHSELAADAARRQVNDMITTLDDELAGGATLEELSAAHGMALDQLDWTADDSSGIAAYDSFREAAAAVQEGDYPEIIQMTDGGVFALRLDELQAPRLQEQSEVVEAVLAGWTAEKRLDLLMAQARDMIPQLQGEDSLASLGLTEVVEQEQTREAFIEGTPPGFVSDVFDMQVGDWRVVENGADVILVRLDAVNPADQNSEDALALKGEFADRSAQEIALDVEAAFSQAVQDKAGVELNRAVITAVHSQLY